MPNFIWRPSGAAARWSPRRCPEDERDRYERILAGSAIDVSRRESTYRESGWTGYDPNRPACDLAEIEAERQRYRT